MVGESTANLPTGSGDVIVHKLIELKPLLSFSKQFAGASSSLPWDYTCIVAPVGGDSYFCIVQIPTFPRGPQLFAILYSLLEILTKNLQSLSFTIFKYHFSVNFRVFLREFSCISVRKHL